MRGILLSHGALFVECDMLTVRVLPSGECGVSPILFGTLEWDLGKEPPDTWQYVSEGEIRAMEGGVYEKILAVVQNARDLLFSEEKTKKQKKKGFFS